MKRNYITYIVLLLFLSCTPSHKSGSEFPVINIEESLKNFQISKLSEFASSIRYVPLETNEDCLVTAHIRDIYLESNKIFVLDNEPYLKVFDAETGKYLYNIGVKGQGPGELAGLYKVDINPFTKKILLCWGSRIHEFDFEGNFLGKIEIPPIGEDEFINAPVITIDDHHFAGTIKHYGEDQKNMVVIFNREQEIIGSLKCYDNPIQLADISLLSWSPFNQSGTFYRSPKGIRYFRGYTDSIYVYNKDNSAFSLFFIIDYGKHKSTLKFGPGEENPDLIKISSINENDRYVFLDFETMRASPEPYEDEVYRGGTLLKFVNQSIAGIFDKQEESFHFLRQPIPGLPGLANDIDGGLPLFVRNVSSNNQLIDYYHADKFLEKVALLPDPDNSFTEIINSITEDDNPIVIIAEK